VARGVAWQGEICNRRKDGSLYWVATTIVPRSSYEGKVTSYAAIRFDITDRKQVEAELRESKDYLKRIVYCDDLTGLPNRRRFQETIEHLSADGRGEKRFHLALMDIDFFKEANDSFGHDFGDRLLQIIAGRLKSLSGERVGVFRLGGDEFGIVLQGLDEAQVQAKIADILDAVRAPLTIGTITRRFSASLGYAHFPTHATTSDGLFRVSDIALYHAKGLGRDRCEVFQPRLMEEIDMRAGYLGAIETGLRRHEFRMWYQPIVACDGEGAISLESLIRWAHPSGRILTAGQFLKGIEDPAIRSEIGMFTLGQVFEDAAALRRNRFDFNRIALNVTNSDFRSDLFVERLFDLAARHELSLSNFTIEVTEGMFLGRDAQRVYANLSQLHFAGAEIALDDFGTGYASLTHLRQLPIDRIKIDMSFVAHMMESEEDRAIVSGLISLAHSLGKKVTAEGVETQAQADLLREMGCDSLQGWHFGKAVPMDQLKPIRLQ